MMQPAASRSEALSIVRAPLPGVSTAGANGSSLDGTSPNRLLASLSPLVHAQLMLRLEPVSLRAGQVLLRKGAPIEQLWFPESAVVGQQFQHPEEIESIGRDGLVGLPAILGEAISPLEAVVRIPGRALRVDAATCRGVIAEMPELRQVFDRYISATLLRLARIGSCSRTHQTEARLATLLLRLQDQSGLDELPLTHERLARLLGLSRRASVTDAIRRLRTQDLVHSRRGGLMIPDVDALARAACACHPASDMQEAFARAAVMPA